RTLPRITIPVQPPSGSTPPDLAISKSDDPDPVLVGQTLTYTLTVSYNGPGGVEGVDISDTLPASVTLNSIVTSNGTWPSDRPITCHFPTLTSGAAETITVKVTPDQEGVIINTASVTGLPNEINQQNNTATEQTTVKPVADLRISKTAAPEPALVG